MRKPTIYEVLHQKLGRKPTNAECNAEVRRILGRDEIDPPVQFCKRCAFAKHLHDGDTLTPPWCPGFEAKDIGP